MIFGYCGTHKQKQMKCNRVLAVEEKPVQPKANFIFVKLI